MIQNENTNIEPSLDYSVQCCEILLAGVIFREGDSMRQRLTNGDTSKSGKGFADFQPFLLAMDQLKTEVTSLSKSIRG
jgi:hypothetical protein